MSANMKKKKILLVLTVLGRFFFMDPDFRPIRIRTQEKKFDPDPEKNSDPKDCRYIHYRVLKIFIIFVP